MSAATNRLKRRALAAAELAAKAEEQVAGLRFHAEQLQALLIDMREKRDELQEQIDNVRSWLGADFAALEPRLHKFDFLSAGVSSIEMHAAERVRADCLTLQRQVDNLTRSMHMRFKLAGKEIGYWWWRSTTTARPHPARSWWRAGTGLPARRRARRMPM